MVVVIANDFDESLAEFKISPGFHHYVEEDGDLALKRFDYVPGRVRPIIERSALARYLLLNLHADETLAGWTTGLGIGAVRAAPPAFVGNVPAEYDKGRLAQSQRAVAAFFRDLPSYADLPSQRILFVVDGLRYPAILSASDSYFGRMRQHFMAEARRLGYAVIDADDQFIPYVIAHPDARFEWPTDGHWNPLANGLIAAAILDSAWIGGLDR